MVVHAVTAKDKQQPYKNKPQPDLDFLSFGLLYYISYTIVYTL